MLTLTQSDIELSARAATKEDAIRKAGCVLVAGGHVAPGYIESMLGRESQANTYLGNGIAIPHGMPKDRDLICKTGISVVQFPEGVEWNPGETVRLVVGIAASSDEHLGILANLTNVLDDPATASRLAETSCTSEIIAALMGTPAPAAPVGGDANGPFVDVVVRGTSGLHARPAAALAGIAQGFSSTIQIAFNGRSASAKSVASLLKLGVAGGETIRLFASGADEADALKAIEEAISSGLGDELHQAPAKPNALPEWIPVTAGRVIQGVSASGGFAIARIYRRQLTRIAVADGVEAGDEPQRFREALAIANAQLGDISEAVESRIGKSEAGIFKAHQAILNDPELVADVETWIADGHSASWAWQHCIDSRIAALRESSNVLMAARASDMADIGQRVLGILNPSDNVIDNLPDEPVILVAEDLLPSDAARIDPRRVVALCTAAGGPTAHTSIIARSLDIPAVVAAGPGVLDLASGILCVIDGSAGKLYVEPSAADLESAETFLGHLNENKNEVYAQRYQPAVTTDGYRIEVVASIGGPADAAEAIEAGAEGVGLLRTEFFFLGRETPPTEDEQFEALVSMLNALDGLPLIVRTLDIGGDKVVPYLDLPREDNPFLGIRGIRLCLRRPELFKPQLRAIYRASLVGPVKIMFPMVATLDELRAAKALAEEARQEIGADPVEIGIMIEVPSAALMADEFAREVAFFSIGTNDLTQYTLAIDRMHPDLAKAADGMHPAVLRLIDMTVKAASCAGKWVGVCGGLAGNPDAAVVLVGLGVTELSMPKVNVPAVKARLRGVSLTDARAAAANALSGAA
ncbi:MAG: phosphoenolpyruvate--protein phosphotransferase [Capsulimonadaceae bacterium]|nr:phosphoenolpyruvate--protein phosphotransferase [Capsulimonadaceae bacterium]